MEQTKGVKVWRWGEEKEEIVVKKSKKWNRIKSEKGVCVKSEDKRAPGIHGR
jgi:hypothetical protein